jgi:hypothetical protein
LPSASDSRMWNSTGVSGTGDAPGFVRLMTQSS